MTAGIDPAANAETIDAAVREASAAEASMLFTPEMSNLIDQDRARSARAVVAEADDPVFAATREAARSAGLWVHLGSLALAEGGRRVNRGIVIDAGGEVRARYDKIHLFDVDLPSGERWRESATYTAGARAAVADTPVGAIGLSICYDLRFSALYAALTDAGATILAIPSAFTVPTGEAHWHVLLRARAIEAGVFVVAAAQTGRHEDGRGTYGHSLVVDPWGRVLLDMGEPPGLAIVDIDLDEVVRVRARLPAIAHRRAIAAPELTGESGDPTPGRGRP